MKFLKINHDQPLLKNEALKITDELWAAAQQGWAVQSQECGEIQEPGGWAVQNSTVPYQSQASAEHRVKGPALDGDFWEGNLLFLPNNEPMGKRERAQFYFKLFRSSLQFLMAGHANGVTANTSKQQITCFLCEKINDMIYWVLYSVLFMTSQEEMLHKTATKKF